MFITYISKPGISGELGISNVSEIVSIFLKGYVYELQTKLGLKTTVKSSEELLSLFEEYNTLNCTNSENRFLASMDVESLFPSLKTEPTANLIKQTIIKSEIELAYVNIKELLIFLRKNMSPKDIQAFSFKDLLPNKKKKTKSKSKEINKFELWDFSDTNPDKTVVKCLLAECIYIATKLMMDNHMYQFSNEIRVQQNEGSIGVQFTGVASEIHMLNWCNTFSNKMSELGIKNSLQTRLVDDITIMPNVIQPGIKLENNILVYCSEKEEEDRHLPEDVRTMKIIAEVANSIDENTKVTFDVPSNNKDLMVPILNVKVKLNKEGKIVFKFYKKPSANTRVTFRNSALSMKNKITILSQECFRRVHNTSELIEEDILTNTLNIFMKELKGSGYNEKERKTILEAGLKTYSNLKEKDNQGIRPLYRSVKFKLTENKPSKKSKARTWFQRDGNTKFKSVMFVDATPGDKLLKMMKETEEKFKISEELRIKFVAKSGSKLRDILQKKNPLNNKCGDNACIICDKHPTGKGSSKCRKNNIVYEAKCDSCDKKGIEKYIMEKQLETFMPEVKSTTVH